MKKLFKYTLLAALAGMSTAAMAEDVEYFRFKLPEDAVGKSMTFGLASVDGTGAASVDWGDGTLTEAKTLVNYDIDWTYTTFFGEVKGTVVIVKGPDAAKLSRIDLSFKKQSQWNTDDWDDPECKPTGVVFGALPGLTHFTATYDNIEKLDCSGLSALVDLTVSDNQLYELTLPQAPDAGIAPLDGEAETWVSPLTTVNVSNNMAVATGLKNEGAGNNQVLGTDWTLAPNLTTLNVAGNYASELGWFDSFDYTECTKLKTLNVNCVGLDELDLSMLPDLASVLAQWNNFTSVDLTKQDVANLTAHFQHNQLSTLTVPDGAALKTLNVPYNNFTFANMLPLTIAGTFNYAPQNDIVANLNDENKVDLSAQAKVGDVETVFAWAEVVTTPAENEGEAPKVEEVPFSDYTVADGVFTFTKEATNAVCSMTNAAYPKLTLKTVATTSPSLIPTAATFDVTGKDMDMTVSLSAESEYLVNYGDGNYVTLEYQEGFWGPDYVSIDGKVLGSKIVLKGDPKNIVGIDYVASNWDDDPVKVSNADLTALENLETLVLGNCGLSAIDLSKNQKLTSVKLESNKFTSFDAELPALETLSLANSNSGANKLYGENAITAFDATKYPALTSLNISFNGFKPDWTKLAALETISMDGNGLTAIELPAMEKLGTLNVRWNELTALDLSNVKTAATVYAIANGIESVKLPEQKLGNLYIANNKLTFATLPALDKIGEWSNYAPQQPMAVTTAEGVVDLSSQYMVRDVKTVYVWTVPAAEADAEPVVFDKYFINKGVFSFTEAANGAVCKMTNEAFPALTLETVALDVEKSAAAVEELGAAAGEAEYYTLQGVRVLNPTEGLYIRLQGGKASKVLVRK